MKIPSYVCIIPARNEEYYLEKTVRTLRSALPNSVALVIADSASTDSTPAIAKKLSMHLKNTHVIHIPLKGKGLALKHATAAFPADGYGFVHATLPVSVDAIRESFERFQRKEAHIIAAKREKLHAPLFRRIAHYFYRLLVRIILGWQFVDVQAGLKWWCAKANPVLMNCTDEEWFLDTEFMYKCTKENFKIEYVPVSYTITKDSFWRTFLSSMRFLYKIMQLRFFQTQS